MVLSKQLKKWVIFFSTLTLSLQLGCSGFGEEEDDEEDTTTASGRPGSSAPAGETAYGLLGSISGTGLNLAGETIIKATYAAYDETSATVAADGSYDLDIRKAAFSITVFENEAPTCNFIFAIGDQQVTSLEPTNDMNLGELTCENGRAEVPADRVENSVSEEYKASVVNAELDEDLKTALLDEKGLTVLVLMDGPPGGGGPGGPQLQGGPGGPPPGGPGGGGGDPGGAPGHFNAINPAACEGVGYTISDFFYRDHYENHGEGKGQENEDGGDATIFFVQNDDSSYDMIVRSQGEDGEEDEIFEGIKLGGAGNDFAMVGTSKLSDRDIKANGAGRYLEEILRKLDRGDAPPPPPSMDDPFCDPVGMVNDILHQLGHAPYTTKTVFTNFQNENFAGQGGPMGTARPLCSTLTTATTLQTIKDYCFADANKTIKTTITTDAGLSICGVAKENGPVNYHTAKLKDATGAVKMACSRDTATVHGTNWQRIYENITQTECETKQQAAWANPPADGSKLYYNWTEVERSMNLDCSELRNAGVTLKACQWNRDDAVEPNFVEPNWDDAPQPDGWWDASISLLEADAKIDQAKIKQGGGHNPVEHLTNRIEQCAANYDMIQQELDNRSESLETLKTAINLIKTTKNADGTSRYLIDSAEKFQRPGEFKFVAADLEKLLGVLGKYQVVDGKKVWSQTKTAGESLEGWSQAITDIKDVYADLLKAANKVNAAEASKCVPDEIGTQAAFETMYKRFELAVNGDGTGKGTNRGISKWQDAAFNHFQCINMDESLRKIRDFGVTAPGQGIKDSNSTTATASSTGGTTETSNEGLFMGGNCTGFYDHRGKCVEVVKCEVPSGISTYWTFDSILDQATIDPNCSDLEEKVAMTGRRNALERTVNGHTVPANVIMADVALVTKVPNNDCSITLKFPKLDTNSCFVFANATGTTWSSLTAQQKAAAKGSDYPLQWDTKKVPLGDIGNKEIFPVIILPNSDRESFKEKSGESGGSSGVEGLIAE